MLDTKRALYHQQRDEQIWQHLADSRKQIESSKRGICPAVKPRPARALLKRQNANESIHIPHNWTSSKWYKLVSRERKGTDMCHSVKLPQSTIIVPKKINNIPRTILKHHVLDKTIFPELPNLTRELKMIYTEPSRNVGSSKV